MTFWTSPKSSRKLELEQSCFDLRLCVEESIDLLASQAAEKDLELAYLFDPHTPHTIVGMSPDLPNSSEFS